MNVKKTILVCANAVMLAVTVILLVCLHNITSTGDAAKRGDNLIPNAETAVKVAQIVYANTTGVEYDEEELSCDFIENDNAWDVYPTDENVVKLSRFEKGIAINKDTARIMIYSAE